MIDQELVEAAGDAIDAARYAHPQFPRERPRPFSEADEGDREYAVRLARAAIPLIRKAALEEAAKVAEASADELWEDDGTLLHSTRKLHGEEIAASLRALIHAQEKQEG